MLPKLYLLFISCCIGLVTNAQTDSALIKTTKKFPYNLINKLQNGNVRFVPVPTFSVSPERGASFGMLFEYFFNAGKAENKNSTRVSNAYINFQYTTLGQIITEGVYSIYTNKERYFLQGAIGYRDFYERYWTLSADTVANKNYTGFDYKQTYIRGKWLKQLKHNWFIGVNFNYSHFYDVQYQPNAFVTLPNVAGVYGNNIFGLGPVVINDQRDNQFSPQKGWFAELGLRWHDALISSEYQFLQINTDLRRYIPLKNKGILALNAVATLHNTQVPFLEKVRLGNDKIMRGYFNGRFRDNNYAAAQIEYRHPIGKSFVLATFLSTGQTAATFNDFSTHNLQSAGGAGIRYLLNKSKKLYIRFDAAYTQQKTFGYYINLGDAF